MTSALLLVDVQSDFLPGGALPVPDGDQIIPKISQLVDLPFAVVVASKDWHPKEHSSFAETHSRRLGEIIVIGGIEQILWPVHCVEDTTGSQFAPGWDASKVQKVFLKGADLAIDSYSAFFDNARRRFTGLESYLRDLQVTAIYIAGLATDYCVRFTALDALSLGFDTYLIEDACRGIDLKQGDVERAVAEICQKGGHVVTTDEVARILVEKSG